MGKLGGLFAVTAAALLLAGCSAPPDPAPSAAPVKFAEAAPSISAAPIPAPAATATTAATPGAFGDATTDAKYLSGVKAGWMGEVPSDTALVGAAKLACQRYAEGLPYDNMHVVEGASNEALENSLRIAVYAGRNYCIEFNPDN